ncbi:nucleotidyltransferase domain-containing protein [uncultured Adlercreutzia sp.]|uniref:nucleotidyltransferase domain-containing protein n=1 Tax=uncultured Adlercreutzia sp. TaxID=875803 RepID=UPI0025E8A9BB|nr:nucleotidyltransferase domain-containing protein [uncultured Adlercreutzia sp.]
MAKRINLSPNHLSHIASSIVDAVPAEAIYVFGSYARGEETDASDLDLYVVVRDGSGDRFQLAGQVGRALLWMGMPKDIIVGSSARFEERKSDLGSIEYVVAHEGVKIYG